MLEIYQFEYSDPNDDDSDDDFLKDGDDPWPTDPDSDDDGWLDGPEFDYWNVTRGYGESTATTNIQDADVDNDNINDYDEYFVYHTDPDNVDTDGDNVNDNHEVYGLNMNLNGTIILVMTNPLLTDTDGDGLDDFYERNTSQSDPRVKDTDDDWLSDYEEEMIHGSDPWLVDTDGDKIDDYKEIVYGTNILSPDTDGDNLSDYDEIEGKTVDYSDGFVIYTVTYFSDPLNPDSDFDSIDDGTEVLTYGSNPLMVDSDRDGLSDLDEIFIHSTNPISPDTDQDMLNDKIEIYGFSYVGMGLSMPKEIGKMGVKTSWIKQGPIPSQQFYDDVRTWPGVVELTYDQMHQVLILKEWTRFDAAQWRLNQTSSGWVTNPLNPDTDGDDIIDGYEYAIGTNPRDNDTDDDGLTEGEELAITAGYGTDPLDIDTDKDGLTDFEEVYGTHTFQNGTIIFTPTFPLLNDSDFDKISDGSEVRTFGTDPMDSDSDDDLLTDYEEIFVYSCDPLNNDTDEDTLTDYDEVIIHLTDPSNNDTDGDGFLDNYEISNPPLSPLDPDYDDDGIPDGMESYYGLDWANPDENTNLVLDGLEHDYDNDGLTDYEELYLTKSSLALIDTDDDGLNDSTEAALWAFLGFDPGSDIDGDGSTNLFDQDSDNDLLPDYNETYITFSNPGLFDTDYDLLDDYYEWTHGYNLTNPDMDADGSLDGLEELYYLSDPQNGDEDSDFIPDGQLRDYDNDTISDWDELYTYFTDQTSADTDGDVVPDNVEIDTGFDPLDDNDYPEPVITSYNYPSEVEIGETSVIITTDIYYPVTLQSVIIYWEFDSNGTVFNKEMIYSSFADLWTATISLPTAWTIVYFWIEVIDIYNHTAVTTGNTINSIPAVDEYSSFGFILFILLFSSLAIVTIYQRKRKKTKSNN